MKTAKYLALAVVSAIVSFGGTIILWFILYMMMGEPQSDSFFAGLIICSMAVPIVTAIYTYKRFKRQESDPTVPIKKNLKEAKKKEKERLNGLRDLRGQLKLVVGLGNLPQGSPCKIFCNSERMKFSANGQDFVLETSKLLDISVMTQTEIQKQYVSSVGGAVAGAVLLGPLGAIIGGRATKKTINNTSKYLVISYISDGETKYIVFDTTNNFVGNSIKNKYKYLKKNENIKVEL